MKKWILTDPATNQYGRQLTDDLFEFKEDDKETSIIDLSFGNYTNKEIEQCINAYNYTLLKGKLKNPRLHNIFEMSKTENEAKWIIAECLFELNY